MVQLSHPYMNTGKTIALTIQAFVGKVVFDLKKFFVSNLMFIFQGSIITADGDCSHEIKRLLILGRKVMTNLVNILKAEILLFQQGSI